MPCEHGPSADSLVVPRADWMHMQILVTEKLEEYAVRIVELFKLENRHGSLNRSEAYSMLFTLFKSELIGWMKDCKHGESLSREEAMKRLSEADITQRYEFMLDSDPQVCADLVRRAFSQAWKIAVEYCSDHGKKLNESLTEYRRQKTPQ